MNRILVAAMLVGLFFTHSDLGYAQSSKEFSELKQELEALKAGQLSIQKDLAELKNLVLQRELQAVREQLQGRAAPNVGPTVENPTIVSIDGGAIKGDKDAKVTLVEFTDYQCPFCSRHMRDTFPQIDNDYVKTGKVRYVLREFPIESIHPQAFKAAEAANCSGEQGKYWEMHDRLFSNQNSLAAQELPNHAQALGLDGAKFKTCLESGKFTAKIRKDLNDAQKYGATGTPTFFVGLSDPKSSDVKAVRKIVGAQTYAAFKDAIDALLNN